MAWDFMLGNGPGPRDFMLGVVVGECPVFIPLFDTFGWLDHVGSPFFLRRCIATNRAFVKIHIVG